MLSHASHSSFLCVQWPEERPIASGYYNSSTQSSQPPEPKKLAVAKAHEVEPSKRTTMIRNYTWSDDTNVIRVYVPVPGVKRSQVEVLIGEDSIDFSAATDEYGAFTMTLRRLYGKVDVGKSSFKVLEKKEKVIIALAKTPENDTFKAWYLLHLNSTNNEIITEALEAERLQRVVRMNEAAKPPKVDVPDVKRR